MKKLILFLSLLILVSGVQAQGFNSRFTITAKVGTIYNIDESINRPIFLGAQIEYFVSKQNLIGLNLNYWKYYQSDYIIVFDNYGSRYRPETKWEWYGLTVSYKLLFDITRFSPFVKLGIGLYSPEKTSSYPIGWDLTGTEQVYGKTCPGYNLGMGVQYRVWKLFSLQIEGTINHIFNKAKNISSLRYFTFANLESGFSINF